MIDIKALGDKIKIIEGKVKTMEKKKLYLYSLVAVALIAGATALFWTKDSGHADMTAHEEPLTVSAITMEPRVIDDAVSAVGVLASRNISVLSSKIMGTVVHLGVREGDYVAQGAVLMRIESGEITAQALQAKAAYNNAKLQYDRIKSLYDEKASTQSEMDLATLGLETAEANLKAAKAMESYTVIIAPISGQIVEKRINPGEMAMPGQPVLKIEDNRNLRLEATVREQDLRHVYPGKETIVSIDALPGRTIKAKVAQVVPAADVRTHSFIVKIDIPADKGLITGMYGRASFTTGKREAILVPASAVVTMSGISGVYLVSPQGSAVFQIIQQGADRDGRIEVLTGLKVGDRVIVSSHEGRIEGRKVVLAKNGE